eukprot:CAMPEP_0118936688 /NCGR_PEP_ID=MMETSP1169-20130426/20024_1 /TAXON_ID=36882 /ORGANISM="Pyramimonas obovata, Strain CCMP722" /LENGTH=322 /DNA_ID=CAMNT_0006880031 /DNA_START=347 /DNA_END=1315 /DNA_ORIENTATION=-
MNPPESSPKVDDDIPIVMTHGFGSGLAMFYRNLDDLSARSGRRVFAVDWLGMGRSSRAEYPARSFWGSLGREKVGEEQVRPDQVDYFLDSLEQWRKEMGIERMHLLGHSWGGYLSTRYTQKYPDRVETLILASPFGVADFNAEVFPPEEPKTSKKSLPVVARMVLQMWGMNYTPQYILRLMGPWAAEKAHAAVDRRFGDAMTADEKRLACDYLLNLALLAPAGEYSLHAFARVLTSPKFGLYAREPLRKIIMHTATPTTFIYGDNDWMYHPQVAQIVAANHEQVAAHTIAGAGHHVYLDQPARFNDCVLQAIASASPATAAQ